MAASAGNHGQGVAYAARLVGAEATVVVPDDAVRRKVDAIRRLGAEVVEVSGGYGAAEAAGHRLAQERGAVWVSPYNDIDVIAGQGTIGLELMEQLGRLRRRGRGLRGRERRGVGERDWVVAARGGRAIPCVGGPGGECSVCACRVSWKGSPSSRRDTDDRRRAVRPGRGGLDHVGFGAQSCRRCLLVSETEVRAALRYSWVDRALPMEPSAAAALAAARRRGSGKGRRRVVVVSGGNVPIETLTALEAGDGTRDAVHNSRTR